MNKKKTIIGLIILIIIFGCEPTDPLSFYGGQDLLDQIDDAWLDFEDNKYLDALDKFLIAKYDAVMQDTSGTKAILIDASLAEIHTGIGWCYFRLLLPDSARNNFLRSQYKKEQFGDSVIVKERYSFASSIGLMGAYYELGTQNSSIDTTMIDSAITTGQWIVTSGMLGEDEDVVFEHDPSVDANDARLLLARSYYDLGDLSYDVEDMSGALYWIREIDSDYDYLNEENPETWHMKGESGQQFNSFAEVILAILDLIGPANLV